MLRVRLVDKGKGKFHSQRSKSKGRSKCPILSTKYVGSVVKLGITNGTTSLRLVRKVLYLMVINRLKETILHEKEAIITYM